MKTLTEQYSDLEKLTTAKFYELLTERKNDLVIINTEDEDDNTDDNIYDKCEILSIYNEYSGNVYNIYITSITKTGGIEGANIDDTGDVDIYRFSDLNSLIDRINLVEILENNK